MNEKQLPGGWFTDSDIKTYQDLIKKIPNGGKMLELGTWKGRSLCSVADLIKEKNIEVWALDSFEGTTSEGDAHKEAKEIDLKQELTNNLTEFGIIDQVHIVKGMTDDMVGSFEDNQFDMIFVDADHTCKAVYHDLLNYYPKLKEGGTMSGHDWSWSSVRMALKYSMAPAANDSSNMWWFTKFNDIKLKDDVDLNKINFSVCFIGRNEAKVLPRALESLKEFKERGGQICYLDTGSTDNTAQIARDFGCTVDEVGEKFLLTITKEQAEGINEMFIVNGEEPVVVEGSRCFDFASARNHCAELLAKNDMVFWLDCDEAITVFDIDKIIEEINNGAEQFEYQFVFAHDEKGAPLLQFVQSKAYLKSKMRWTGVTHEVLTGEAKRVYLPETVYLNEHWQNHETNRSGYLKGLAVDAWMNPKNDRQSHYLGRELMWNGRIRSAIKEFERHLTLSWWNAERAQSMVYIGNCYAQLGDKQKAKEWYFKAIDEDSGRREPYIKLAEFFKNQGEWQKVACFAAASLQVPWSAYYANDQHQYTFIPHMLLAEVKWYLGDRAGSKEHYDICLSMRPDDPRFLHDYRYHYDLPKVDFVIPTLGRPEGLEKCINSIKNLVYPQELINIIVVEDTPRQGVPKRVKEGFGKGSGEYVVYAANDCEFEYRSLMQAIIDMKKENKALCAFNIGEVLPDEGNINAHFIIQREFVDKELGGEIFDTEFNHLGVDNLLWARAKKKNQAMRSERARVFHHHFSVGEAEFDEVYQIGWDKEMMEKDRELLKKKLEQL